MKIVFASAIAALALTGAASAENMDQPTARDKQKLVQTQQMSAPGYAYGYGAMVRGAPVAQGIMSDGYAYGYGPMAYGWNGHGVDRESNISN